MNILSLFDGMACGLIALEKLGLPVDNYYASEVDKYAMLVADDNYPNIIRVGDVRDLDPTTLPKIDLMIGGSPCTNFSLIGNQQGMSTGCEVDVVDLDHYLELKAEGFEFKGQSYLFWEYIRLKRDLQPEYFLLENVKMAPKWESVLSNAIGVRPIQINSTLVSAQNRVRFYWTNIQGVGQPADRHVTYRDVIDQPGVFPATVRKGTPRPVQMTGDKFLCLTATYYKGVRADGRPALAPHAGVFDEMQRTGECRMLTPVECERLQTVPDNYTSAVSNTQRYKMLGNGWTVDVIAHIFKHMYPFL